jgi:hypothetical protein
MDERKVALVTGSALVSDHDHCLQLEADARDTARQVREDGGDADTSNFRSPPGGRTDRCRCATVWPVGRMAALS